ncbi:hypothetical protein BCV71DRAFT_185268, partial [Rhizopus microsporus]
NTMQLDAARIIKLCFNIITEWKATGMGFQKSCVFISEAGLNSHQVKSKAWSVNCTLATVQVPTQRGVSLSIVGCISPILNFISFSKMVVGAIHRKKKKDEC